MKITTNCKNIQDFCQCVDRSLGDSEFTNISVKDGNLRLYAQTTIGSVSYSTPVEFDREISVGVFTKNLSSTFKKVYGEDVDLVFSDKYVHVKKDNIKVGLPVVTKGEEYHSPRHKVLECDSKTLSEHVVTSVEVLDKTGFIGAKNPCVFVDNSKEEGTYICRFSDWSFRFAKIPKIDSELPLICIPEGLGRVLKHFKNMSHTYIYNKNKVGCIFQNGVTVFLSQVGADMPVADIFAFGIDSEISTSVGKMTFNRNDLYQVVDTVSSILGDTEGFIEFDPVGSNSEGTVWEVKGKTSIGLTASERALGTTVEGINVEGFGVNKKIFGKVLKTSNAEYVHLVDLNSSMLGVFIDNQVVYLMSKIHRG